MSNKKRILLVGNMNNNFFSVARYLRDEGYEAHVLLLRSELGHFLPSNDTFLTEYKTFVRESFISNYPTDFAIKSKSEIVTELDGYDFYIGCGPAPAYFNKIGKKLDVFVPYGSDIFNLPFLHKRDFRELKKFIKKFYLARNQKKGIEQVDHILLDNTNDKYEQRLTKFKLKGKRLRLTIPFLYYPEYTVENINRVATESSHYARFKELRDKYKFIVFHHSGHSWQLETIKKASSIFTDKGNDKVIKGFSKLLVDNNDACLILFEYSNDVAASKELIAELGIEDNVAWFPKMARKEIMIGLSMCDVGVGEITHPWVTYGTIVEVLASGKPVIMNRNEAMMRTNYPEIYPNINATNADEVYEALKYYYLHPEEAKKNGVLSKEWFIKYMVENSMEKIISLIEKVN